MVDKIADALLANGISGIAIIILLYAVYKLWLKYDEVQEKRIAESREATKAIEQNTNTLDILSEVLKDRAK